MHRGADAAEKQRQLVQRIVETLTEVLSDPASDGLNIATRRYSDCWRSIDLLAVHRKTGPIARLLDRRCSPVRVGCESWQPIT